ncbi:DEKNAAC102692 [Brettanomyces naardenensis]|uniref:Actin-related protein 2/3 complex subunit 5 n=1 Tax=Brettanomyces naardenensis TaxID=13370 RepID=A0A448YLJ9_BRENA|nr:DEKNAAC102692 [Brettanomyces naardenensis]
MEEDWRRIDVDQFDPESQFVEDDLGLPSYTLEDLQGKFQQIRQSIASNNIAEGIKLSVTDAPYGSANDVKQSYLLAVLEVLNTAKQSEVNTVISQLSTEEVDVLVKIVYALMATSEGQRSGGALLGWLDKIVDSVGEGPIVRYLSDPYRI